MIKIIQIIIDNNNYFTKWIRVAAKIPPALLNALAKLSRPAPKAALTIKNTAKYQDIPWLLFLLLRCFDFVFIKRLVFSSSISFILELCCSIFTNLKKKKKEKNYTN